MARISNHDLEHHESIIALANGIERRSNLLQLTTNDLEILRALQEIETAAISIKNKQQQKLKEQKK